MLKYRKYWNFYKNLFVKFVRVNIPYASGHQFLNVALPVLSSLYCYIGFCKICKCNLRNKSWILCHNHNSTKSQFQCQNISSVDQPQNQMIKSQLLTISRQIQLINKRSMSYPTTSLMTINTRIQVRVTLMKVTKGPSLWTLKTYFSLVEFQDFDRQ